MKKKTTNYYPDNLLKNSENKIHKNIPNAKLRSTQKPLNQSTRKVKQN